MYKFCSSVRWIKRVTVMVLPVIGLSGWADASLQVNLTPALGHKVEVHSPLLVLPDGRGLPSGAGNATVGRDLYLTHCAACHGLDGNNGPNDKLVGGHGTLASAAPLKTVGSYWPTATTLFDFIRRAMPYQTPGVLTDSEVYALSAYILFLNDIVDETTTLDANSLPQVVMPNADGFVSAHETTNQKEE